MLIALTAVDTEILSRPNPGIENRREMPTVLNSFDRERWCLVGVRFLSTHRHSWVGCSNIWVKDLGSYFRFDIRDPRGGFSVVYSSDSETFKGDLQKCFVFP